MRKYKQAITIIVSIMLIVCFALPAYALNTTQDSSAAEQTEEFFQLPLEASLASEWLQTNATSPAIGGELTVLALLRSGSIDENSNHVQQYLQALSAHIQSGAAAQQELSASAWQAMVWAAAGQSPDVDADILLAAFTNNDTVATAGTEATRLALLLFGPIGLPAPSQLQPAELAAVLASSRNPDGGYGESGISDALTTSRVLQALAFYRSESAVEEAVAASRGWLRANIGNFGGFDVNGAPNAQATAEAVIALGCLSETTLSENSPSPADGLLVFQTNSGGFAASPDSTESTELTALSLLALSSQARLQEGLPPVYRLGSATGSEASPSASGLPLSFFGMSPLTTGALLAVLAAIVALVVILAVFVSRRKRGTIGDMPRPKKPKSEPSTKKSKSDRNKNIKL